MTKKLIKHGNSWALVIEKPILRVLGIDEKTNLEILIKDTSLVVRAARPKNTKNRNAEIDEIAKKIIEKYDPVFKALAKK